MMTVQYIIIGVVFIGAIAFLAKKFMPSKNKSIGSCGKGCGCGVAKQDLG